MKTVVVVGGGITGLNDDALFEKTNGRKKRLKRV